MSLVEIKTNLDAFTAGLKEYGRISRLSGPEALVKQASKFTYFLQRGLMTLTPEKGAIRSERLAAMKAGGGIHIRQALLDRMMAKHRVTQDVRTQGYRMRGAKALAMVKSKGKRMNFWALAARAELNLRESGRKWVALSARHRGISQALNPTKSSTRTEQLDRYKHFLSSAGLKVQPNDSTLRFDWGGSDKSSDIAKVLGQSRSQTIIARAIADTTDDMMAYIKRKHLEADLACARTIMAGTN